MLDFLRGGGVSMVFVLALAIAGLVWTAAYARRPDPRHIEGIRALTLALCFAAVAGVASDVAAVMSKVPAHPEWSKSPDLPLIVMTGLGESMAPAVLGFAAASVQWMLMAYGHRRLARQT